MKLHAQDPDRPRRTLCDRFITVFDRSESVSLKEFTDARQRERGDESVCPACAKRGPARRSMEARHSVSHLKGRGTVFVRRRKL